MTRAYNTNDNKTKVGRKGTKFVHIPFDAEKYKGIPFAEWKHRNKEMKRWLGPGESFFGVLKAGAAFAGNRKSKMKPIQDVKERCVEKTFSMIQAELNALKRKMNGDRLALREEFDEINLCRFAEGLREEGKEEYEIERAKLQWCEERGSREEDKHLYGYVLEWKYSSDWFWKHALDLKNAWKKKDELEKITKEGLREILLETVSYWSKSGNHHYCPYEIMEIKNPNSEACKNRQIDDSNRLFEMKSGEVKYRNREEMLKEYLGISAHWDFYHRVCYIYYAPDRDEMTKDWNP